MSDDADGDERVGHCRPPRKNRWKKGQSGNPSGGRRKQPSPAEDADKVLRMRTTYIENGRRRTASKQYLIMMRLGVDASKGDKKAAQTLFAIRAQGSAPSDPPSLKPPDVLQSDREILRDFIRDNPDYLATSNKDDAADE